MKFLPQSIINEVDESIKIFPGDLLIAMSGATTGKLGFNNTNETFLLNQRVGKINTYLVNKYFIYYYLITKVEENLNKSVGSAIPNLSTKQINELVIPLPPLPEQHRIVQKVNALFQQIDRLAEQSEQAEDTRTRLRKVLLHRLEQAPDRPATEKAWLPLQQQFDLCIRSLEDVQALRQTILQLAVKGQLVPQNPEDEPASVLLERIKEEKARLVKEGKIKKSKPLPPIEEEEVPFEVPEGWVWCRLGEVSKQVTDGDHKTPPKKENGMMLLSAKNVRDGFIDYSNCDFISQEHYQRSISRCHPELGDLLIVSVGGTIGRTSLVKENKEFALVRSVALIKPTILDSEYLRYVMNSPLLQSLIESKKRGGAQPCLYLGEIKQFIFPLPPLNEQHRIVAKVELLMQWCRKLEEGLNEKVKTEKKLVAAAIG